VVIRLPRALADELVAHARSELPNEACGILGGQDGAISSFHATRNADASPYRYTVEPRDAIAAYNAISEQGDDIVAIYHSHTKSAAYPSRTDVELAELWPGTAFIIVSLAGGADELRAFFLSDGIEELELVVE
jgi:proteasome lid subunit RPN8/RPN11